MDIVVSKEGATVIHGLPLCMDSLMMTSATHPFVSLFQSLASLCISPVSQSFESISDSTHFAVIVRSRPVRSIRLTTSHNGFRNQVGVCDDASSRSRTPPDASGSGSICSPVCSLGTFGGDGGSMLCDPPRLT